MTARRTLLLIAISVCAVALSGCGYVADVKSADSEAIYVNVGQLKYQVQFSRELNPYDTEDSAYLEGLSPATVALTPALATTRSRWPQVSTARATAALACAGSRTSPAR